MNQSAPSTPPPYWQSPPSEEAIRPAASPPTPEPYRPPPVAEPYRPPQPTPDLYQLSSQQDDMWFVVDLPGKSIRFPLRYGEIVTLGRDTSQNIVIEDKTLSRNHLIMQRNGDRINVQVLGLNGLVYANQVYKSTTLEVAVPATLAIGNVACKIEKKFDSDATILMSDQAAASRQHPGSGMPNAGGTFASRPASPAFPPPQSPQARPWGEHQPFPPAPEGAQFPFSTNQPIPPVFPAGQQAPGFPGPSPSPPSFDFRHPESPGDRHHGSPYETPSASIYETGGQPKGNKNLLFIGSGIGLVVLVVAMGLFFWLRSPAPVTPQAPPPLQPQVQSQPQMQPQSASGCVSGQGTNNLYAKYLSKARVYFKEGNKKDACDYLKDIPQTSACYAEAVELAKQIDDCKLE